MLAEKCQKDYLRLGLLEPWYRRGMRRGMTGRCQKAEEARFSCLYPL